MMKKIILIVLFVVSLLASDNEEIGIPYIEKDAGQIDSAVLAPDGKSFYTLKDSYFIHWNLSPLKKLQQWNLPLKQLVQKKFLKNHRDVYLLNNETKILIISRDELILYNLQTKKIEKRVACKNHSQVLDGDLLYVARSNRQGDEIIDYPHLYLDIWKIPELIMEKSVDLTKQSTNFKHNLLLFPSCEDNPSQLLNSIGGYKGELIVGESVIYYFTRFYKTAIIDKASLALKDVILNLSGVRQTADGYLVTGQFVMKESDASIVLRFPDTLDRKPMDEFLNKPQRLPWFHIPYRSKGTQRSNNRVGNLMLLYPQQTYAFYKQHMQRPWARLYQYKNELLISNVRERTIELSSKDFKLFKMRTKDGYIVPMNNATFKKYNKPLQIKVQNTPLI